jgi:glucosamine kinase
MQDQIAALDGGGTKTSGALADHRGNIELLPGLGGCNPQDNPDWAAVLTAAIQQVLRRNRSPLHVVLGLPGFGEVPHHDAAMTALVADMLPDRATILNDVALAYHGAFVGLQGVMILAGTGSMVMAQGAGSMVRTGGWGDLIGDEGSAFWIGQKAMTHVSRGLDGRLPESGFAAQLLARLSVDTGSDPFGLLNWLMQQPHPRSAIASLARLVDEIATEGDPVAIGILERAGAHLVWQARTAARHAGLAEGHDWSSAGSVFRSQRISAAVTQGMGRPQVPARLDPLGGGLWLAAKAAGWTMSSAWIDRVGAATRTWSGEGSG